MNKIQTKKHTRLQFPCTKQLPHYKGCSSLLTFTLTTERSFPSETPDCLGEVSLEWTTNLYQSIKCIMGKSNHRNGSSWSSKHKTRSPAWNASEHPSFTLCTSTHRSFQKMHMWEPCLALLAFTGMLPMQLQTIFIKGCIKSNLHNWKMKLPEMFFHPSVEPNKVDDFGEQRLLVSLHGERRRPSRYAGRFLRAPKQTECHEASTNSTSIHLRGQRGTSQKTMTTKLGEIF